MILSSITQDTQRETNISIVMRSLRKNDRSSRISLSKQTGLTQATITKIISQLIEWGAVSEVDAVGSGVGRKAISLHLNTDKYLVSAVRINRKYIHLAIYDMDGRLYDFQQCEISYQNGAQSSMNLLIDSIKKQLDRTGLPVRCIGVAVPGPFNYVNSRISLMSGFPGWIEIDIKDQLKNSFGLPVFVDRDANCGAMSELWYATPNDVEDMLFICADRGIGAGLILNSSLYRGAEGFAGEFGHASINVFGPRCECGNRGCLELYGSTIALENTYCQEAFNPANPDSFIEHTSTRKILSLVRSGDPLACTAYKKNVGYLGVGVAGLINAFNPHTVVFADNLVNGGSLFLQVITSTFKQILMPEIFNHLRIKICELDGDPMLLGAAVLAFDHMLTYPLSFFVP